MRCLLLFSAACLLQIFCYGSLFAQQSQISGKLKDNAGSPVAYATVSLIAEKDSAVVLATQTDNSGSYNFKQVSAANYIIKVTAVGYVTTRTAAFTIEPVTTVFRVQDLVVAAASSNLATVTITAVKPRIEQSADKTTINVASSILAAGSTVMDILARAPGVSIDKDDNISLKGKQGVTVMINDKPTYLTSSQLATLLAATDGSTIQSIEIITSPSAKYDAAGSSGIINIKLKKTKQRGTNGSLTAGGGYSSFGKDNETLTLNHREGNLNVFGSFSHNDNKREQTLQIRRVVSDTSFFDQYTTLHHITHNNTYRLGADYDLSTANTIGFVVNGYDNTGNDNTNVRTTIGRGFVSADSSLKTISGTGQTLTNFSANVNDSWKIDTSGQLLSIDLDYARFSNISDTRYLTSFFNMDGGQQHPESFLGTASPSVINIRTGKVDYNKSLTSKLRFEAGVKASDVKTDNDLLEQTNITGGPYSNYNHFVYEEKVDAAYANLNANFKGLLVKIGLRAEYTASKAAGDSSGVLQNISRHYLNLFPSLMINRSLDSVNEIGLSFNRRIDRPQYDKLNPFIYVLDPYTYIEGNSFLRPQYTTNLEFSYTWKKQLTITLGYNRTTDVIGEVPATDPKTKIAYILQENLQLQRGYSINLFTPYVFTKWWEGNANVTGFYSGFTSAGIEGADLDRSMFSVQFKTTQFFSPSSNYNAELTTTYQSGMDYSLYYIKPQFSTDAGISHSFDAKKAIVKLSLSDIFNTLRADASSMYQNNNIDISQKRESRIIRLTITYNFGTNRIGSREHSTGADEERGRVKGS